MSVKVHEAFSIDSFQDRLLFSDDFLGAVIRDLWFSAGTGSVAVVDAQDGGIVRITTGATNGNTYQFYWGNIRSLHVDKKVTMECRVRLNSITSVKAGMAIQFDGSNTILINYDTPADSNWQFNAGDDGGFTTNQDSGVVVDTDWHIFRIEAFPTGEVHFYIDGTEGNNSPITTNIPSDAGDYLQPLFELITEEDVAKTMDVDYCVVRQEI